MKSLFLRNLRDIVILPFSVTCIIPALIHDPAERLIIEGIGVEIAGTALMLAGLSLFSYTVFLFNRVGKGTLAPWSQKVKLVVNGPYRYSRNPMISGVCTILLGESLLFQSKSILVWTLTFFAINTIYFWLLEEPALSKKFGHQYDEYKKNVPRWIPRTRPYVVKKFQS